MTDATTTRVPTFCALRVPRCGATATIADGEFLATLLFLPASSAWPEWPVNA